MANVKIKAPVYLQARVAKLRQALAPLKLSALLITAVPDVSYITGFEGDDAVAIVTATTVWLVSDTRFSEQIQRECPWVRAVMRSGGMSAMLGQMIATAGWPRVGVQAEAMTLKQKTDLVKNLGKKPATKLVPVTNVIAELRHIKDDVELAITRQAVAIAEQGFIALLPQIVPGMTENECASLLAHEMRKRGAAGTSFDTIIGARTNSSLPHYRPGQVAFRSREALLIDWGARYKGYCSDLTRMVFIGGVPPIYKKIYPVVLEAQLAAIAAIAPGKTGKEVDAAARDLITKAGYGPQFGHGTGHSVGREIHESVSLSRLGQITLKPGMIVTVEPGIYLPGMGGVRIEDDVLVTAHGYEVLSTLPKDMAGAVLH